MKWALAHPWLAAAIVLVAGGALGFGFGRYSKPTKVLDTAEKVVEVHEEAKKTQESVKVEAPARVTTTTRTRPAPVCPTPPGCPECPPIREVVRVEERGQVVTARGSESTQVTDTRSEEKTVHLVENDPPRLMLGATAAFQLVNGVPSPPAFGALVGYRLVGPVWALGQGEVGAGSASFRVGVGLTLF